MLKTTKHKGSKQRLTIFKSIDRTTIIVICSNSSMDLQEAFREGQYFFLNFNDQMMCV